MKNTTQSNVYDPSFLFEIKYPASLKSLWQLLLRYSSCPSHNQVSTDWTPMKEIHSVCLMIAAIFFGIPPGVTGKHSALLRNKGQMRPQRQQPRSKMGGGEKHTSFFFFFTITLTGVYFRMCVSIYDALKNKLHLVRWRENRSIVNDEALLTIGWAKKKNCDAALVCNRHTVCRLDEAVINKNNINSLIQLWRREAVISALS